MSEGVEERGTGRSVTPLASLLASPLASCLPRIPSPTLAYTPLPLSYAAPASPRVLSPPLVSTCLRPLPLPARHPPRRPPPGGHEGAAPGEGINVARELSGERGRKSKAAGGDTRDCDCVLPLIRSGTRARLPLLLAAPCGPRRLRGIHAILAAAPAATHQLAVAAADRSSNRAGVAPRLERTGSMDPGRADWQGAALARCRCRDARPLTRGY